MDILKAKTIAEDMMKYHGLYKNGWTFKFDRAVRRLGVCKYKVKQISLSEKLTAINHEESVFDTILHEIAHALLGSGYGHSMAWKKKAQEIGCSGLRTAGKDHISLEKKWVLFDMSLNKETGLKRNRRFSIRDNSRYEWRLNKTKGN